MPQLQESQSCMARALYDNIAESPDELAFRRGDTLTVLEQNTASIEGWWLCSLRGRQGICPGNRLRILAGVYHTPSVSPELIIHQDFNTLQRQGKRRSWHVQPNKVLTPQKFGDVYLYDCPPSRNSPNQGRYDVPAHIAMSENQGRYAVPPSRLCDTPLSLRSCDTPTSLKSCDTPTSLKSCDTPLNDHNSFYDVPPRTAPLPLMNYDSPRNCVNSVSTTPLSCTTPINTFDTIRSVFDSSRGSTVTPNSFDTPRSSTTPLSGWRTSPVFAPARRDSADCYDVPRALLPPGGPSMQQLTPSSSASSLTTADSMSSSNRSSRVESTDYDIPRPTKGPQLHLHPTEEQLYDVPQSTPVPRELPLELHSALDALARLQSEATASISRLLGYAGPQWRRRDRLEPRLMDVKLAVVRLRTSLHDLAEFGEGALGNAAKCPDKGLTLKLQPLVKALRDADKMVQDTTWTLDGMEWSVDALARTDDENESRRRSPDALDQLVACARALTEDVRQTASFIQGNSTLLFKRSSASATSPPPPGTAPSEWLEDYDYVNLESREAVAKKHDEIIHALPTELRKSYDQLVKEAEMAAIINESKKEKVAGENELDAKDKKLLAFYASQIVTHTTHLTHAIDAFLQTVEHNQPPKVFLAHSKFVVLSAHRLVHIGDTVHRNIVSVDIRTKVLGCANALSEALATTVAKTKQAAIQFPSVTAVQEMVDAVVDVSHLARDLKLSMVLAAQAAQQQTGSWRAD